MGQALTPNLRAATAERLHELGWSYDQAEHALDGAEVDIGPQAATVIVRTPWKQERLTLGFCNTLRTPLS
jgi:hypothetical protein